MALSLKRVRGIVVDVRFSQVYVATLLVNLDRFISTDASRSLIPLYYTKLFIHYLRYTTPPPPHHTHPPNKDGRFILLKSLLYHQVKTTIEI